MTYHNRNHGLVLVWVTVMLSAMLGFVGLAVDYWYVSLTADQLQSAADAAALAGARLVILAPDDARQAATDIAAANQAGGESVALHWNAGNLANGDLVLGRYDEDSGTFEPTEDNPDAVKVVARRDSLATSGSLPLQFGPMFGVNTADVSRYAIAKCTGQRPGVIILDPTGAGALQLNGNTSEFIVNDAVIQVNSSSPTAVACSGGPTIQALSLRVVGGVSGGFSSVNMVGELKTGVSPVPDPLASLPEPTRPLLPGTNITVNNGITLAIPPGYYRNVDVKSGGTLILLPGLFYIDGLFDVKGNLTSTASMIFIGPNGEWRHNSNGLLQLTAMEPLAYPLGPVMPIELRQAKICIFQSRRNTRQAKISGGSNTDLRGTLYFPNATLHLTGNCDNLSNGIIVHRLEINGTGAFVVNFDGRFPPLPGVTYLVR